MLRAAKSMEQQRRKGVGATIQRVADHIYELTRPYLFFGPPTENTGPR
jgi:hypothetical protein